MDMVGARVTPQRGEIWLVALDPTQGSEIRKARPCLIVSPDEMNRHLSTAIIAPLTTTIRAYPSRVNLQFRGKRGQVALDQIRAIDRSRMVKRLGHATNGTAIQVFSVLVEMFRYN